MKSKYWIGNGIDLRKDGVTSCVTVFLYKELVVFIFTISHSIHRILDFYDLSFIILSVTFMRYDLETFSIYLLS